MNQTDHHKKENKKVFDSVKEDLAAKMMKEFAALTAKTYSYLTHDNDGDKKAKHTLN